MRICILIRLSNDVSINSPFIYCKYYDQDVDISNQPVQTINLVMDTDIELERKALDANIINEDVCQQVVDISAPVEVTQERPNKRDAKTKSRVSMRVKTLKTVDSESVEKNSIESLTSLNEDLPEEYQFSDFGSSFKYDGINSKSLLEKFNRLLLKKEDQVVIDKNPIATVDLSLLVNHDEKHPFFNSAELFQRFRLQTKPDMFLPDLLMQVIVFSIGSTPVEYDWTINMSRIVCAMLQFTVQFSSFQNMFANFFYTECRLEVIFTY